MEIDGDLPERRELQKGEPSNPWLTPDLCELSVRLQDSWGRNSGWKAGCAEQSSQRLSTVGWPF